MTLKEWRSCPEYLFTDALELLKKQEPESFMDGQYYEQVLFEIVKKLEEQPKLENGVWLKHVEYPDNKLLEEQPKIVRCKDCKHYMTIHCTCDGCCISDNWFCADGEVKQE